MQKQRCARHEPRRLQRQRRVRLDVVERAARVLVRHRQAVVQYGDMAWQAARPICIANRLSPTTCINPAELLAFEMYTHIWDQPSSLLLRNPSVKSKNRRKFEP